jgi:hypothetical protein
MDLRASNDNNNRNNLDSELGAFEKFEQELKNTIFGVLFVLLKEQEISIYTTLILAIIQFIQLLIFPFHETINETWNSEKVVKVLHSIVNYFNIVTYLDSTSYDLYVTFFYIGIAILGFAIVNVVYVNYAFSRKKFSFNWPIMILKYIATLFVTILYLPFLDYFISIVACVKDNYGNTVHSYFSEVTCWSGMHILHAVFAIIGSLIFFCMSIVISLTFFEYKSASNDTTARVSARVNFLMIIYKTLMVICLTFLTGDQFQVLLLALILIGSLILFVRFYFSSPYHNEIVAKVWSTLHALNLWTAVMLVFAKIMENTLFEGSIIAWLLGIPFVILIILTNRDHRIDLLLINVNKFSSGQEVQDQIRYLLKLIEWQAANRNSAILLDGYIEIHKQSCNKDDCPLKQKVVKNNRFTKNLMSQDETLNEKYALLIQLLYKMYSYGIKKFPNNTSLRIAYAFFLLEKMQSKQQALQELSQAEQNKPPFDEQFIIFRYKKIIEDEIAESQAEGQGGLDVVSESAFQNHLRQLQANIEKSALLHMEFWSQLSEDNPDLAKLNDIGSKINSSVHNVEEHWNKLLKINANNAKAMRLYGKFLIEIINDKEAGDDLLEKARNLTNVQANKKIIQMSGAGGDDYSSDATPTVWVSGEQDKFSMITGINLAAASLFGYNKTELLNRKVTVLMPGIYAKHHDSFLENYLNTGEASLIGKNKERLIFGKNKSNYIFPIYLSLRSVQSIIQGIQFIATFRVEKNFKNAGYLLTQPDGTIDAVSSSSINILKVDLKMINQKKANIQDLIPNIIKDRYSMFSSSNNAGRASTVVDYQYPRDSEYLLDNEDNRVQLNCHLTELVFLGGRENAGFQFRFERIVDRAAAMHASKKAQISNFQFKFDKARASILGEYAEGSTTTDVQSDPVDEEILSGIQNTDQNLSDNRDPYNSAKQPPPEEVVEEVRKDYGIGIKTLRLVNGRPQEIDDEKNSEDEENDDPSYSSKNQKDDQNSQLRQQQQQNQQEEDPGEEGSYRDFSTTFKSRKALTTVVNDKTPPSSVKNLRWTVNLLGLALFIIALLDYIFAISEFDKINTDIELLDKSNQQISELMTSLSNIRDLYLINIGLMDDLLDVDDLKDSLQTSLDNAKKLNQELEQETDSLSTAHLNLLNSGSVELKSSDQLITTKGLSQATEEIISRAFDILSLDITEITDDNGDYYYVTWNLLNDYYEKLTLSSEYYAVELSDRVNEKGSPFLILLIASIVALILALIILFPILFQVNKIREEVLSLFLDIPEKTVKGLYNKCETFISNLQVGEDEDMISEIDEEELDKNQDQHEAQDFIPRRRRKRFKNSGRSQRSFFIKSLGVALVLEAYFLYTFISSNLLLGDISTLIPELNSTSVAESFFSFANNAERNLFIDPTFKILDENAEVVATNNIKAMYDLDSLILEEHSINRKIHSDSYANIFNNIMMSNPCSYMTDTDTTTCAGFADQTVYQGMTVALSRHFENLRTLLSCFSKIQDGLTCTVSAANGKAFSTNAITNATMNLFRTTQAIEINTMQEIYIKDSFRTLMTSFRQSIKDQFSNQITIRLIVFIVFLVLIISIYIFIWQTLVRSIINDIWRTKSMLNMIPLNVIAKIKSIRLYLKRFWNERNLSEA